MTVLLESGFGLLVLFLSMLGLLEAGRRIGRQRLQQDPAGSHSGVSALEGAVFGLMGLLLAFTFSGAATRFEARRQLILKEANAIGTAWLRLDILPESLRPPLRAALREYVDQRLAATRAAGSATDTTAASRERLWSQTVGYVRETGDARVASILLPALNDVFDVATERSVARETHPPRVIFGLLLLLALICSAMAGYGLAASRTRSWLHILCFAGSLLLSIYVIFDLEFPRQGFLRVDQFDQLLVALRATMN